MSKSRRIATAVVIVLATLIALAWRPAVRIWTIAHPTKMDLPLAAHLVAAGTPEGSALLAATSTTADHAGLMAAFEPQQYASYCGVASSVIALKALGLAERSQDDFFTPAAEAVRPRRDVFFSGMTLEQLAGLLRSHGAVVEVHHAADLDLDGFRRLVTPNLNREGDVVLINYLRKAIDQESGGHISPLSAYDPATDRFLVLDVAAHKYPPVWVEARRLFESMNTIDSDSKQTRGFVLVSRP
jgi:hypothetical protein